MGDEISRWPVDRNDRRLDRGTVGATQYDKPGQCALYSPHRAGHRRADRQISTGPINQTIMMHHP
jgi:hypothetical protein